MLEPSDHSRNRSRGWKEAQRWRRRRIGQWNKGSHIVFYTLLFGLLLSPTIARAQSSKQNGLPPQAPTGVVRLTLEQAVNLAVKQNTTAQIAQIVAKQSVEQKNIARAELLPQANLNVGEEWQRINLAAEFGGGGFPGLPPGTTFPGHIGPFSLVFRGRRIQRANFRSDVVPPLSVGTQFGGREQVRCAIFARASDFAGGVAVHRNAASDSGRAGFAIARRSGAGAV